MTQEREIVSGGFLTNPGEAPEGRIFVLNCPWEPKFSDNLLRKEVVGIRISAASHQTELGFFADLPSLKYIDVYSWAAKDLSPLEAQRDVEHLGLECQFKRSFDFQVFPKLRELLSKWRPGMETALQLPELTYLHTNGYPFEDVKPLTALKQLRRLGIESRKVQSLSGIEALSNLEDVSLVKCPALADVSAIGCRSNLRSALFYSCKKVMRLDPFSGLEKLERLSFENGGEVESIGPLAGCSSLREFFLIDMSVADGDLSPLLDLPRLQKVVIARKRHHSHTMQELNEALEKVTNPKL